jgi:hypothetical protein
MRPGRLAVLVGTLVATGALYLKHLAVDATAFRALTGGAVPTIWQELGSWGRPAAALLAGGLVAVAFRPGSGLLDRWGGVAGGLLAGVALAGGVLARQAAAADASAVSAALGQAVEGGAGACAGVGFWLLLAGLAAVGAGVLWDLAGAWLGEGSGGSVGEADPPAVE